MTPVTIPAPDGDAMACDEPDDNFEPAEKYKLVDQGADGSSERWEVLSSLAREFWDEVQRRRPALPLSEGMFPLCGCADARTGAERSPLHGSQPPRPAASSWRRSCQSYDAGTASAQRARQASSALRSSS